MRRSKRKVIFSKQNATHPMRNKIVDRTVNEEQSPDTMSAMMEGTVDIPAFLLKPTSIRDSDDAATSHLQDQTVAECLPLLKGVSNILSSTSDLNERGIHHLQRESHVPFAEDALGQFPAPFVALDASRPWMVYWALTSLYYMGEDIGYYQSRTVKTFYPLQNLTGGYGGGQGHLSHLAGTYAALLSLASIGSDAAYELTDRKSMWEWLGRLKQPHGGFEICEGGEEDVRAAYCALLTIALLDLPWNLPLNAPARKAGLQTFGDGLGEFLSRCQTYEGGISATPGNEAHGAYTFCAVACLCLLGSPEETIEKYLDVDGLLSWLSARQYAPEGGFAGRTNKVVDGCYSHWVGSCFPLVQAALSGPQQSDARTDVGNIYHAEGLSRYILNCCQAPGGGLRDKPSKNPDAYHTCYTLTGLSTTEHHHYFTASSSTSSAPDVQNDTIHGDFSSAFNWQVSRHDQRPDAQQDQHPTPKLSDSTSQSTSGPKEFNADCDLRAIHPIFVIPHLAALSIRKWAEKQERIGR